MVRVGAVRARSDDDERHLRMAFGDNGFGDVRGHVGLGPPRHQELRHPRVHPVDRGARLTQRVDLGAVLDHSQPAQHIRCEHRDHTEHLGQRQQVQRRHRVRDGCGRGRAAEHVGHHPVRVVAIHPVPHRDTEFGGRRLLQRSQFHPRHHNGRFAGCGQHQRGQPLEGLGARADQVAQVVSGRDDQPGQPGVGCGRRGGPESLRIHVGAESARCHGTQANPGPE